MNFAVLIASKFQRFSLFALQYNLKISTNSACAALLEPDILKFESRQHNIIKKWDNAYNGSG